VVPTCDTGEFGFMNKSRGVELYGKLYLFTLYAVKVSRDSAVGIATGYGLDD
jgi:hypothetical protein